MAYTNSALVTYKNISKNKTSPRNHAIDTITIHCIVGQWTAKQGCDYFATTDRECSSNYIVGKDGSIGLSVEEKDRSWCSSSSSNDHRAITIEVASDTSAPYAITDEAYNALITLCADICKRNGINQLLWKADKSLIGQVDKQNMSVHRWFANKSCPGDYLYERHGDIAEKVNKLLGTTIADTPTVETKMWYRVRKTWSDASSQKGAYLSLANAKSCADKYEGYSVFDDTGKVLYTSVSKIPYMVRVSIKDLNIRKGAGTNFAKTGKFTGIGTFTIIEEKDGKGATKWGKLKSGAGWISLDYTTKL
ncbi:MAG: peptidoglycan recognition family protein [Anaerovoracaceae bacterium]